MSKQINERVVNWRKSIQEIPRDEWEKEPAKKPVVVLGETGSSAVKQDIMKFIKLMTESIITQDPTMRDYVVAYMDFCRKIMKDDTSEPLKDAIALLKKELLIPIQDAANTIKTFCNQIQINQGSQNPSKKPITSSQVRKQRLRLDKKYWEKILSEEG